MKARKTGAPGKAAKPGKGSKKAAKKGKSQRKEQHKLDQILRVLFRLSKRMALQLINSLFGEQFASHEVKAVYYGNPTFVDEDYNLMVADVFMHLDTIRGTYHYHVELQTMNDRSMVIRMFRYGFEKAVELALNEVVDGMRQVAAGQHDGGAFDEDGSESIGGEAAKSLRESAAAQDLPILAFPSQIVIFVEENAEIGEELAMRLRLPDGAETLYKVPVLRYWTLSPEDLRERKLYALLPLQVFRSRKKLQQIDDSRHSEEEKQRLFTEAFAELKVTVQQTLAIMGQLETGKQLSLGDMDRMLRALDSILAYLYRKYGKPYEQTKREVTGMIKTFIDPEVRELARKAGREEGIREGKFEVARNMLALGFEVEMIHRATGLAPEEIELERSK